MSAGLERLQQRDEQQRQHVDETQSEVLTSIFDAITEMSTRIATLAQRQEELARFVTTTDELRSTQIERLLQQSTTQSSARTPSPFATSESVASELREIGQTLQSLDSAIDGKSLDASVKSLTAAVSRIERTTAWNSEQADEFVRKYRAALNAAGRAINATRDRAEEAIHAAASSAAAVASQQIDTAIERVGAATASAERTLDVAERLQRPLAWAAAGRLALTFLPVAVVVLMAAQVVWALAVGVQWLLGQDWELWLIITAGVAGSALLAGAVFGFWRLAVWVKGALDEAGLRAGRSRR